MWTVQINGKMLIASSSRIVGLMNSQAIARSDMPPDLVIGPDRAEGGTEASVT